MGIARNISKLFSADTSIVTSTELTSALSSVSASISNIDVTSQLNSLIAVQSASPSSSTKIWINTSASANPTFNTYSGGTWRGVRGSNLNGYFTATGGTVTTSGNYRIHTFTSTSSFILGFNFNL